MSNFIGISDARENFPDLVNKVNETMERITITVHGKPKAILMSYDELESLEETAGILAIPGALKSIKKGEEQIKKGKFVPLDEILKEL